MANLEIGTRVRVVDIEKAWDKERYSSKGKSIGLNVQNGDEGTLVVGIIELTIQFDNGEVSQDFTETELLEFIQII